MTNLFEIGITNAVLATVLALGVWLVTRFWRQPVFVHALWLVVLLKLITPPMVGIPWRWSQSPAISSSNTETGPNIATDPIDAATMPARSIEIEESSVLPIADVQAIAAIHADSPSERLSGPVAGQPTSESHYSYSWVAIAASAWIAGSALFLIVTVARLMRFHRALADTAPASEELCDSTEQLAKRFGISGGYRLRITEGRLPPLVWPIGRPTIVLSRQLLAELSPDETQTLLAHELAHLRRKDHWVRWLELVAVTLYWWHPVAWWARAMIRNTEERACDAWVVWAFPDSARRYAAALFTAVEFVTSSQRVAPLVASRLDSGGNLKERIENVMNGSCIRRLSFVHKLSVLVLALVVLPLSLQAVRAAEEPAAAQVPVVTTPSLEINLAPTIAPSNPPTSKIEKEIEQKLQASVKLDYVQTPLVEVMGQLGTTVGVDIHLDPVGLNQEGVSTDAPVSIVLKNQVSLRSALNLILKPLHLSFAIEDEVVKVTSEDHRRESDSADQYQIAPGELLKITAVGVAVDEPIADIFLVEPSGSVALGPRYGRVKVAGLTIDEAEQATRELLRKQFKEPIVQITLGRPQRDGAVVTDERAGLFARSAEPQPNVAPRPVTSIDEASPDELDALREHARFLEERFKAIDAKNRAGSPGGSQDVRDMTGYEMATAQAELALATGERGEAAAHFSEAEKFAESALRAAKANYDAGRITNDMVLQAANNLTEGKRRMFRFRETQSAAAGQPPRTYIDARDARQESARSAVGGDSTLSIGVIRKLVEGRKQNYERLQALASKNLVSANELERVRNEFEAELARLEQAQRALKYYQLQVELAKTEYQEAVEKNKTGAGEVTNFEVRKLQLKVEMAKAKLDELAE